MSWLNQNSLAVDRVGHCLSSWVFFAFLLCSLLSLDPLVQQASHPLSWSLCVQEVCFLVLLLCSMLCTVMFWFRLVISNIIVWYETWVKSCSFLFSVLTVSNISPGIFCYVMGLLLCLPALGFQYSLIKIWEITHLLHQLPLWPAGKLFCITAFMLCCLEIIPPNLQCFEVRQGLLGADFSALKTSNKSFFQAFLSYSLYRHCCKMLWNELWVACLRKS